MTDQYSKHLNSIFIETPSIEVDQFASLMSLDGYTKDEVDEVLKRLSLELNGILYNYRFDPSGNQFIKLSVPYKSDLTLPTEKQIMYAISRMGETKKEFFDNKDLKDINTEMSFELFQTFVEAVVSKPISGVPILNMLLKLEKVVVLDEIIRWID